MKLTSIAVNQTQNDIGQGVEVFFSYKTPVAAFIPGQGYIRTNQKWSRTTSKHINKWLDGANAVEVSQSQIEDWMGWNA